MRILLLSGVALLAGCQPSTPDPVATAPAPIRPLQAPVVAAVVESPEVPATPAPATDAWLGKWIGPEGTFLELGKMETGYAITIQSLDGPTHFDGTSAADQIEFTRNGQIESIRASNGAETGMKWLAEKKDCLTIKPGEGFCRD